MVMTAPPLREPTWRAFETNATREAVGVTLRRLAGGTAILDGELFSYIHKFMKIVWDDHKRMANISKHGFDFATLTEEFFLQSVIVPANHGRQMTRTRPSFPARPTTA
jgi:hypothetical protein